MATRIFNIYNNPGVNLTINFLFITPELRFDREENFNR